MIQITSYGIRQIAKNFISQPMILRLSVNRDFTKEPIDSNYKPVRLSSKDWKISFDTDTKIANITCAWIEWIFSDGYFEVYGFYITDSNNKNILEESFVGGPCLVVRSGDKIKIKPKFKFSI